MALLSLSQFVSTYNGKSVDVDKAYGYQCWDLAALYSQKCVGVPASAGYGLPTGDGCAAGVYYNFLPPLPTYYTRIANTVNALPKPGDLIVWKYGLAGSGGCGHIAIVLSANWSGFTSFDQNWGGKYAHKVSHNWNQVAGWLRPKRNVTSSTTPASTVLYYTIVSGDSLGKIAAKYGTTVAKLVEWNKAKYPSLATNPNYINVGWKLRVR